MIINIYIEYSLLLKYHDSTYINRMTYFEKLVINPIDLHWIVFHMLRNSKIQGTHFLNSFIIPVYISYMDAFILIWITSQSGESLITRNVTWFFKKRVRSKPIRRIVLSNYKGWKISKLIILESKISLLF